ncbi:MAG TPA: hypothetical protein VE398_06865 [Acidobacteriota bacterium]|nr:hypothetical protein [Acidobacteriota bacterium]
MSRKSMIVTLSAILLGAMSVGAAAQQYGPQGPMHHAAQGTMPHSGQGVAPQCHMQLDLAAKTALEGTVESVSMAAGQGMPSFTIQAGDKKAIIVASPYWALTKANFDIKVGDRMSILAFPSLQFSDTYVAADLKNLTTGKTLLLRDDNGIPVNGIGPRHGAGPRPF